MAKKDQKRGVYGRHLEEGSRWSVDWNNVKRTQSTPCTVKCSLCSKTTGNKRDPKTQMDHLHPENYLYINCYGLGQGKFFSQQTQHRHGQALWIWEDTVPVRGLILLRETQHSQRATGVVVDRWWEVDEEELIELFFLGQTRPVEAATRMGEQICHGHSKG